MIKILKAIECHNFKEYSSEIRCALPNKHNSTALSIKKNTMSGRIFLPNDEIIKGDIYTLIMKLKECNFIEALKFCNSILGNETTFTNDKISKEEKHPLAFYRNIKHKNNKNNLNNFKIEENFLNQYIRLPHINFIKDRIGAKTQQKYDICFNEEDNRIIIPHRQWDSGDIVGLFGRTTIKNFEELNIPKYFGICPYPKSLNLYGLWQNYNTIQEKGYVIVLEAEKSVMQLDTYGIYNGVAIGSHEISPMQRRILIGLNVEIVIAFDKGISENFIRDTCSKFRKYRKCTYIYDDLDLLPDKASPSDLGIQIFNILFQNRK